MVQTVAPCRVTFDVLAAAVKVEPAMVDASASRFSVVGLPG